ncbi:radical SAM protein [Candidatus Micrarchaeota archaeon]|nr:radical SAM protein [Candidatus Micrarchaeota archaeon]
MDSAEKALPGYFSIRRKQALPYFKMTAKVACEKQDGTESLWKEHGRAMQEFDSLKSESKGNLMEMEDAEYSLLDLKRDLAYKMLESCTFCARRCNVNRAEGQKGWCRVGADSHVSSMFEHMGEEHFLIPSGTIFFSGCTWECVYCQNYNISQFPERGMAMAGKELAAWLDFRAQAGRIINANFVGGDPSPNLHTIMDTLRHTKSNIPMIWNSNMYMSRETVKLLDGAMDAYLADFRYGNNKCAMELSKVPAYMETITRNYKMIKGRAEMVVRILALPSHVECDAIPIIGWLSENMPESIYVNLMSQYFPHYKAKNMEGLGRRLKESEFEKAAEHLRNSRIRYYEIQ